MTRILTYGILSYIMMVSPSYAIYSCSTPEFIKTIADTRGYILTGEDFHPLKVYKQGEANDGGPNPDYTMEYDLRDGRTVTVYFNHPRRDRPELLCMYKEEIERYEMGGIRL